MLIFQPKYAILNIRTPIVTIRDFSTTLNRCLQLPQLSPYDVNQVLRENEFSHTFADTNGPVMGYESNQLASNKPVEDARTEASFIHKNAFICGIFDGHAGPACAQVVSKRLLRYIAAGVIDRAKLHEEISKGCTSQSFLKCHNDKVDFVKEIQSIYENSFSRYITEIADTPMSTVEAIEKASLHLDADISAEALQYADNRSTLSVAMTGSVSCVALVEDLNVYVATTGDCAAVIGSQQDSGRWTSKKLSFEHNAENISEVKRIISEHPPSEADTVIKNSRLLGELAPLRAFGDYRYKWSKQVLQKRLKMSEGDSFLPSNYHTPPYLTAKPDVIHHTLTTRDKFLVVASDGLWDFLSPSEVVSIVGDHIMTKKILDPLRLPEDAPQLGDISKTLSKRKAGRKRKPLDQNSATHLIRNALGGTDQGIEHSKISYYLSLPQDVVRLYRDDITITVLYFNSEYVKN